MNGMDGRSDFTQAHHELGSFKLRRSQSSIYSSELGFSKPSHFLFLHHLPPTAMASKPAALRNRRGSGGGGEGWRPVAGLRKPVFTKVDQLRPQTSGHTLTARVLSSRTVLEKGAAASPYLRSTRIDECLVGDETGTILFTARNDQIDLVKPGTIDLPQCQDRHVQGDDEAGCRQVGPDRVHRAR